MIIEKEKQMEAKEIIEAFGKLLISDVRDHTIETFDGMLQGTIKGITAQKIQEKIKTFDQEQMDALEWMVPQIVDLCLHNMLWMAEQQEDITLLFRGTELREESDGLAGELYTEDGWIQKYSSQRYEEI